MIRPLFHAFTHSERAFSSYLTMARQPIRSNPSNSSRIHRLHTNRQRASRASKAPEAQGETELEVGNRAEDGDDSRTDVHQEKIGVDPTLEPRAERRIDPNGGPNRRGNGDERVVPGAADLESPERRVLFKTENPGSPNDPASRSTGHMTTVASHVESSNHEGKIEVLPDATDFPDPATEPIGDVTTPCDLGARRARHDRERQEHDDCTKTYGLVNRNSPR